ncbi:GrpB family protein [Sporosarcina gallistercoris]|uniref:GrpB family protein n=1 Tax=Sporosarcina gallistercoris TaxID=2762245 RepID=A0ABR8PMU8_9BACL|nr:GrpB family protein [Sporosarcina gallistercoris]MBD7909493.1 GrpB family protein [Sporosarcina gallistercoris]
MILGLVQGEIQLVEPQVGWQEEFQKTRQTIHDASGLGFDRIEHIGSTSIHGIKVKPMIDIALGVDDIHQVSVELLKSLKSIQFYRLQVVLENEVVLAKFLDNGKLDTKTHIIHLVEYEGQKWDDFLSFRDQLNASESLAKEYEVLKMSYLLKGTGDMNDYTKYKEEFVRRIAERR